jgi:hypothetical protein
MGLNGWIYFRPNGGPLAFVAIARTSGTVRKHPSSSIPLGMRDLPKTSETMFLEE